MKQYQKDFTREELKLLRQRAQYLWGAGEVDAYGNGEALRLALDGFWKATVLLGACLDNNTSPEKS